MGGSASKVARKYPSEIARAGRMAGTVRPAGAAGAAEPAQRTAAAAAASTAPPTPAAATAPAAASPAAVPPSADPLEDPSAARAAGVAPTVARTPPAGRPDGADPQLASMLQALGSVRIDGTQQAQRNPVNTLFSSRKAVFALGTAEAAAPDAAKTLVAPHLVSEILKRVGDGWPRAEIEAELALDPSVIDRLGGAFSAYEYQKEPVERPGQVVASDYFDEQERRHRAERQAELEQLMAEHGLAAKDARKPGEPHEP
ncbi:uncharacterized protein V1510DRAFT_400580 [Dipodascopsis tothii]|uniref:uncharacterized protein n=1 Tax=Dipodascopsis tothii TaxID=44089 RepID=UPI0034CD7EC6